MTTALSSYTIVWIAAMESQMRSVGFLALWLAVAAVEAGCNSRTLTSEYVPINVETSQREKKADNQEAGQQYVAQQDLAFSSVPYYLPRGLISISIKPSTAGGSVQITQNPVQLVADRRARYLATWHENQFSIDKFTIAVDSNGLLTSINSDVTDQTPQIAQKLADIATQAAIGAATRGMPVTGTPTQPPPPPCQGDLLIDPYSGDSIDQAKTLLKACALTLTITFPDGSGFPTRSHDKDVKALDVAVEDMAAKCASSLCFRPAIPVLVRINNGAAASISSSFIAAIPDIEDLVQFDLTRGPCIDRVSTLTFTGGVLTKADLTKPSEILGCLDIPLSFAKAFAGIPGQVLTVQVQNATSEASLLQQERNILLNQNALLAAKLTGH